MQARIDLEKAAKANHSTYMLRLLWPLNDMLSLLYLSELSTEHLKAIPNSAHIHDGAVAYMLRLREAHLVEGYEAFVSRIERQATKDSVYAFVTGDEVTKELFERLQSYKGDKRFRALNNARDSLTFHYNYSDQNKVTAEAIKRLLADHSAGQSDGNLIIREPEALETRFVIGDRLANHAWRYSLSKTGFSAPEPTVEEYRDFIVEASSAFVAYAESAFLLWVATFDLALPLS